MTGSALTDRIIVQGHATAVAGKMLDLSGA
jgi:hypothetical protein